MTEHRDKSLLLRVSGSERERWRRQAEAEGLTLADWMRRRLDGPGAQVSGRTPAPRRRRGRATAPPELVAEIGRVGNNLNQLARWANTWKGAAEATQVVVALAAIDRQLSEISDVWTPGREGGNGDAH